MFIQTEATPNPATLKFIPGKSVLADGTADFTDKGEEEWQHLKPMILGAIMEHFMSGAPVVAETANDDTGMASYDPKDEAVVATIKELLETRVRPAVAQDGGDITFSAFREGVVYLHMRGACSGCPSSTATLRHGIENLLRHFCPEVQEVQAV